jgi:hypothetical protein
MALFDHAEFDVVFVVLHYSGLKHGIHRLHNMKNPKFRAAVVAKEKRRELSPAAS